MKKLAISVAVAALAFASVSDAAISKKTDTASPIIYSADVSGRCHDASGKFVSALHCHHQAPPLRTCVKGKACGNSCIKMTDQCHK